MTDSAHTIHANGLWYEEFTEGLSIETRARTITEADIVNFANLSGDFNPMHTDAEYAKTTDLGARVAHGALIFSVATGLAYRLNILEGTVIAFRSFEMKMSLPVYIGDTIKLVGKVVARKDVPAAKGGLVTFEVRVVNQKNEAVQKGTWLLLMSAKPQP
jgi:3-hydroxybutyryl-CoA dehydratase